MKHKTTIKQALIYCLMALAPVLGAAQTKNVISALRVFPKVDKIAEFEKALAAHAQKFHNGDAQWHVFEIQTGPDFGGYQITEGPKSWEGEDARGNLGEAHTQDWNKNVAIYLTDRQNAGYFVYQESLSTIALGDFTEKIQITHAYPKIGQRDNVAAIIKKMKKEWEASGITVAVYASSSSGPAQYTLETRHKQGFKERADGFFKPFKESYESVNGEGSFAQHLKDLAAYIQETWSELLIMRKDLSSK